MKKFIVVFTFTCIVFTAFAQTLEYESKWILDIKGKTSFSEDQTKSKQLAFSTPDKGILGFAGFKDYASIGSKTIYHKGDFKLLFKIDSLGKLAWYKALVEPSNEAISFGNFVRVDKSGNIYLMMGLNVTANGENWPADAGGLICLSPNGDYKWSKTGYIPPSLEKNYFESSMYNYSEFNGVFVYQKIEALVTERFGIISPDGQFKPMNNDYKNIGGSVYYHPLSKDVFFLQKIGAKEDWQVDSVLTIPAETGKKNRICLLRMDSTGKVFYIGSFYNHAFMLDNIRFCAPDANRIIIGFSYRAIDTLWYNGQKLGTSTSATNPAQICLDRNGKLVWYSECDYNYFGGSSLFVFEETIRNGKLISLYSFYDNTTGMYWDGLQQEGGGQFLVTLDTATGNALRLMKTFFYGRLSMLSDTKYAELITFEEAIDLNGTTYYPVDSINRFFIALVDTFTKPNAIAETTKTLAQVYPNPSNNSFSIAWEQHSFATATIYNANGVLLQTINQNENSSFGTDWPSGIYMVKIDDKNGRNSIQKIIKIGRE